MASPDPSRARGGSGRLDDPFNSDGQCFNRSRTNSRCFSNALRLSSSAWSIDSAISEVVALLAPLVGRQARRWGRRPLLLIGFGALPIRALLFAWTADPLFLVGLQLLDGISAAIVGVLTVLVTADLTHGTGRFNLAQGIIGTASGLGA